MLTLIVSLVIVGLLIADVFFVEFENFGWTTLSLIATGGAIYWYDLWGVPQFVVKNGPLCIAFGGAYLVVGIIWSFIKWYSYLLTYRDRFFDIKNDLVKTSKELIESQWEWIQKNHITNNGLPILKQDLPYEKYGELTNVYLKTTNNYNLINDYSRLKSEYSGFYKPEAIHNKSKIVAWICYWPFSLIGTFINDPIRRLVNFLFTRLKATYQKMSDKVFQDFPDKNDF